MGVVDRVVSFLVLVKDNSGVGSDVKVFFCVCVVVVIKVAVFFIVVSVVADVVVVVVVVVVFKVVVVVVSHEFKSDVIQWQHWHRVQGVSCDLRGFWL